MALPISYNVRNVFVRWRATLATIMGVALVVAVYVLVQSLAGGLGKSQRQHRRPAQSHDRPQRFHRRIQQHGHPRRNFNVIPYSARRSRATPPSDRPLISADVIVLINLPRGDGSAARQTSLLRGISPVGMALRPQVALVAGRWFTPGKREVVVSRRLARTLCEFRHRGNIQNGAATN